MGKKIFVGGLAWVTNEPSLEMAFAKYGAVTEAKIIMDREVDPPRSKGFGFVTFDNPESVDKAIEGMNQQELDGRIITVNEAQDRRQQVSRPKRDFRDRSW